MRKVCILILLLFCMGGNTHLSDSQAREYDIERFNLYAEWFTEPVESLYFLWSDGNGYKITSYEWDRVSGNPADALQEMSRDGYDISTCSLVIHNHILPTGFSRVDIVLHQYLLFRGFRGMFLLYTSRGVFILRDDK